MHIHIHSYLDVALLISFMVVICGLHSLADHRIEMYILFHIARVAGEPILSPVGTLHLFMPLLGRLLLTRIVCIL